MPAKLLNIFVLSALAFLFCSFAPSQTLAVSVQGNHKLARQLPNHHGIAKKKKKRDTCKPRPSSSYPPSSTPASQNQGGIVTPSNSYPSSSSLPLSTTSSTSPPSTSPTNTPSTTPSGPGKLAIAWAMGNDPRISFLIASSRVKMFHLWSAIIPDAVKNSGLPVSIMLWGIDDDHVNTFLQYAKPGYATHAYGFNEVNEPTQAYTSVADAVPAWKKYLRPLADQGYTLGSPCTTSAPDGINWVDDFLKQCDDCHVDEILVHWYDVHFSDFQTYVESWADKFKKPVRITEFACQNFNGGGQPSMDDIWSFTTQAINWLESYEPCLSYAPFGFMDDMYNVNTDNRLFSADGLSALGWLYVNGH